MAHSPFRPVATAVAVLCGFCILAHGQQTDRKAWLVPANKRGVVIQETALAGAHRLILENGFLRAVINPAQGGRIESLIHKRSGKELTMPLAETIPGGLLSDHVWQQNFWHGDWTRAPYTVKILEQTPELVRVEMTSPPGSLWVGVSFQKTLTIWRDRSVLQADYAISANDKVAARCRPDFHFHQALAGQGKAYLPSEAGLLVRPVASETEDWVYDPSRGWLGFIGDNGAGIGFAFDYKRVKSFRASTSPVTTLEWVLRKTELKAGSREATSVRLAPFAGLKEITAVGERLAADLSVGVPTGNKVEVRLALAPFQTFKGKISLSVRPMNGGEPAPAFDRNMGFDADSPAEFNTSIKLAGEGNWIVSGVVRAEGMDDLSFEKPVFAPHGKGTYAMEPEAGRVPETPDSPTWSRYHPIDLNFNSTAIPTPHPVWAKPWAGGRPRLLALMPEGAEREAVELAQRFDLDLTCAYLCANTYYALGDGVRSLRQETVNANLEKTLERDFDVIAVCAYNAWGLLTPRAKELIVEKVKAGTGLVFPLRGESPPELKEYMPLEFYGYDGASGTYTLVTNSPPMLAALPYAAMPISYYSNGSRPRTNSPVNRVLLEAVLNGQDRGPLVAIGQIGKGRLVETCTEGNLVPPYGKFVSIHVPDAAPPDYDYWEYHYAMAARMIYWAAHKESPVNLIDVVGATNEVKLTLASQIAGTANVELTVRDKFGAVLERKKQAIDLKSGDGQAFALPVSGMFQGAAYLADVIVSNDKGVLAFGAGVFPAPGVRFTKLAPEKPVYLHTDTASVIATITNAVPPGAVVRARLLDGAGRLVVNEEFPASTETKLSLPLGRVIGPMYEVRATLLAGGRVLDQTSCEGRIKAIRNYETFKACFWGGVGGIVPANVIDAEFRLYQSLGMNSEFEGEGPLGQDIKFLQRLNLPYTGGALGMYTTGGVTKEQAATNKVEIGLASTSLTGPIQYFTNAAPRGARWKDDDILMYSCGDENRGSGKDVDFSEQGKQTLRDFLKEKYFKTIAELNAEWGTQFKSWDEVIAMTEAEAKEHLKTAKTCAPWLDQRLLMTWGAAQLAKGITDGVRSTDPTALVGESGSEEPAIYGTDRDWWYMSRSYTALAAYGGEQTVEQECYNPTLVRYTWSGYGKSNPINRSQFYNILSRFDKGIAVFAANSHLDPDFTLPECGRDVRGTLIELQRGIGQMLVSAKPARQPVFILQSQSSLYAAYMLGLSPFASVSRATAMRLIEELGIEYQYISYEQLATGHLNKVNCRVLVLPATVALSPAEIAAIRDWVKNGGTLIADMKTALMTAHGRMYAKPELDDVFGIDRTAAESVDTDPDSSWTGNDANGQPVLQIKTVERGIKGTATPLGNVTGPRGTVPIVFHNAYGKGHAYYFAADIFGAYTAVDKFDAGAVARIQFIQSLFDKALGEAGVGAQVTVQLRDPKTGQLRGRSPWVWTGFKRSGNARFAIVLRNYGVGETALPDLPVTVQFAEPGVIYDVVAGKLLGRGDSVNLSMFNSTGRIFAILPSEVVAVDAKPPTANVQPGDDVTIPCEVKVASGKADPRVLHVDVIQPDGEWNRTYSRDVTSPDGRAVVRIPFALNDAIGDWNVRITDIASGVSKTLKVSLK